MVQLAVLQVLRPIGAVVADLPGDGIVAQHFNDRRAQGVLLFEAAQRELGHHCELQERGTVCDPTLVTLTRVVCIQVS